MTETTEKEALGPYRPKVGDVVEVNRLQNYMGEGTIEAISTDGRGGGTKLFPAYLVELYDGTTDWFSYRSLTKV